MIIGKGKTNYEFKKQKEKYEKRKTNIKKLITISQLVGSVIRIIRNKCAELII